MMNIMVVFIYYDFLIEAYAVCLVSLSNTARHNAHTRLRISLPNMPLSSLTSYSVFT